MQAYVKDNAALLLEKPDQFATIIMHIPQGCIVNVSYSHGDWYAIIFAGTHGFLQSSHLSFRDVQSCWADRYGPGATSLYRQNATPDQIEILQGDLIRFFHPVCINLDVNGTFDF